MRVKEYLCTSCGTETDAPLVPGSPLIGTALLFPFVLPGIVYFVWRRSVGRIKCPMCKHNAMIPSDSPLARTWRSSGWLPGQPMEGPLDALDPRLLRIEQAIDAIAGEVERVGKEQRKQLQGSS
jgi:hypothetical protein